VEPKAQPKEGQTLINKNRDFTIDSLLILLMKGGKNVNINQLINEVMLKNKLFICTY